MVTKNRLIIAAAGSGKTTYVVEEAIKKIDSKKILITTFTQANEEEIKKKFFEINKFIPSNVVIQTWFSFLIQHGAKPYQGCKFEKRINGLMFTNEQSQRGVREADTERHYFTHNHKIYSDKLSKFVVVCNTKSNGLVIDRISRIFPEIFIDEIQDLSGYDLELVKLFIQSKSNLLLVGDPRQGTYSTSNSAKNKQYKKGKIIHFFEDTSIDIEVDDYSLVVNYRCSPDICDLSNKLYPDMKPTKSGNSLITGHDGVFFIKNENVKEYMVKYKPMQLRWDQRTAVIDEYPVMNFGLSKGLEFDRVLIYPTAPFIKWLKDNSFNFAKTSRSKFYVALTRARFSVGIVLDENIDMDGVENYFNC